MCDHEVLDPEHATYVRDGNALCKVCAIDYDQRLPWPRDLYRDYPAAMAQPPQRQKLMADDLCPCGRAHRHLFPRTTRSTYGRGWHVAYFCSDACKGRAVRLAAQYA
jgi:hypothetical protein